MLLFLLIIASVLVAVKARQAGVRLDPQNGVIAGVCAGVAKHCDWPVVAVRIVAVAALLSGVGLIAYSVFWLILNGD